MSRKRSSRDASQRRSQRLSSHQPAAEAVSYFNPSERSRPAPGSARAHELNTKRRGELAEIAFSLKATTLGFAVSKPYGDSERYDFIVDSREPDTAPRISRVQVKCSTQIVDDFYRVNAHRRIDGRAVPYQLTEVDFLAAYVIPEDSWFIIPLRDILGVTSLLLRRKCDRRPHVYNCYREAWHLLRAPDEVVIM